VAALAALGCATPASQPGEEKSPDGLVAIPSHPGEGKLFVDPNHPIGAYDDWFLAEIGISYAKGQQHLSKDDETIIYQMMADTVRDNVGAYGQALAKGPGPCTLAMALYLTNLTLYRSGGTIGSQEIYLRSYGSVQVVAEFRDSLTKTPLLRYGERRILGGGVQEGAVKRPDLLRLGETLQGIVKNLAQHIGESYSAIRSASRADQGCEGRAGVPEQAQKPAETKAPLTP